MVSDSAESTQQSRLAEPAQTEDSGRTVHVVVGKYADDPHPHVLGVYEDEDEAEKHRKKCCRVTEPPHPVAWGVAESEVLTEYDG